MLRVISFLIPCQSKQQVIFALDWRVTYMVRRLSLGRSRPGAVTFERIRHAIRGVGKFSFWRWPNILVHRKLQTYLSVVLGQESKCTRKVCAQFLIYPIPDTWMGMPNQGRGQDHLSVC